MLINAEGGMRGEMSDIKIENGRCYMGDTEDRRERSKEHSGIVEER